MNTSLAARAPSIAVATFQSSPAGASTGATNRPARPIAEFSKCSRASRASIGANCFGNAHSASILAADRSASNRSRNAHSAITHAAARWASNRAQSATVHQIAKFSNCSRASALSICAQPLPLRILYLRRASARCVSSRARSAGGRPGQVFSTHNTTTASRITVPALRRYIQPRSQACSARPRTLGQR